MDRKIEVEKHEERLRQAIIRGDVAELDTLISDDALYTDHNGRRIGKEADLDAHRTRLLRVDRIDTRGPATVQLLGESAVVCVSMDLAGSYDHMPFGGAFAYTRVWHRSDGQWRIRAAHSSAVVPQ